MPNALPKSLRLFLSCWLLLLACIASVPGANAVEQVEIDALAVEIAYRIDRELGVVDAAQRHLLVWRLSNARQHGELTAGTALENQWRAWQQRLERLEQLSALRELPAWFQPIQPSALSALLASNSAAALPLDWELESMSLEQARSGARTLLSSEDLQLSSGLLPPLLAWAHAHAPEIWQGYLTELANNPESIPLAEPLIGPWLALPLAQPLTEWQSLQDRSALEIARFGQRRQWSDPLYWLERSVALLNSESLLIDRALLDEEMLAARYAMFSHRDRTDRLDRAILSMATAVRRCENGEYAQMIQALTGLAMVAASEPVMLEAPERLGRVLDLMAALDSWLPAQLGRIDGHLLTVFQETRRIIRDWVMPADGGVRPERAQVVADLAALNGALEMIAPDFEGYLEQPFRESFNNNLLICFALAEDQTAFPPLPINREQFDNCVSDFFTWATNDALRVELAGDANGPFEDEHLERELALNPWQRINYWLGFVQTQLAPQCDLDLDDPLANPVEWALASRALVSFAERWPAYAINSDLPNQVDQLTATGRRLLSAYERLRLCRAEQQVNPIVIQMQTYEARLDEVSEAIQLATARFRQERLVSGADVRLDGDAMQSTRFVPQDLPVKPCTGEPNRGMDQELVGSRALFELFPGAMRIAHQVGLGQISLCYDQVQWVDRRAELPAVRDQSMANYFGHLSFELTGQYSGLEDNVFRFRLTSEDEYEYLFGQNAPEVLDDPCPRHLINVQVSSELPERAFQLVPRRLTFVTADRMQPAKVFAQHWDQGDEWRDWFVTGHDVVQLETRDADDLVPLVSERLSELNRDWNSSVYVQMLMDDPLAVTNSSTDDLADAMRALDLRRRALLSLARLIHPEALKRDPALRASLFGVDALFDRRTALEMQQDQVPVNMIATLADGRFEDALLLWRRATNPGIARPSGPDQMILDALMELTALRGRLGS